MRQLDLPFEWNWAPTGEPIPPRDEFAKRGAEVRAFFQLDAVRARRQGKSRPRRFMTAEEHADLKLRMERIKAERRAG